MPLIVTLFLKTNLIDNKIDVLSAFGMAFCEALLAAYGIHVKLHRLNWYNGARLHIEGDSEAEIAKALEVLFSNASVAWYFKKTQVEQGIRVRRPDQKYWQAHYD